MTIPGEVGMAFFPPSRKAGNVVLHPLTLAGAVRLAGIGVDLSRAIPRDRAFDVAAVLSVGVLADDGARRAATAAFLRRAKVGLNDLCNAIEATFNDAFSTYVQAAPEKGETTHLTPHGLGWPLELAEFLCAEYGWHFDVAAATPVATAFALLAAAHQRNGGKHKGLDYLEREYAKQLKAKKHG